MKRFNLPLLGGLAAVLVFTACTGDDYDPSATDEVSRGKLINTQPENKKAPDQAKVESEENLLAEQPSKSTVGIALETKDDSGVSVDLVIGQTLFSDTAPAEIEPAERAVPPAPEPPKSTLPPLAKDSPFREVSFRALSSFPYDVEWESDGKEPDPTAYLKRVPREIRQFSGSKVAMEGFMMPTMVNEDNKVTEFLLMPDQMSCCYGTAPASNGWIVVTSPNGVDILMDQIIRVTGSLMVEERWDEEFFQGLYHLDCEKITGGAL